MLVADQAPQEEKSQETPESAGVKIIEELYQTASTADWFKTKGRHEIFAAGKQVPLAQLEPVGQSTQGNGPSLAGRISPSAVSPTGSCCG